MRLSLSLWGVVSDHNQDALVTFLQPVHMSLTNGFPSSKRKQSDAKPARVQKQGSLCGKARRPTLVMINNNNSKINSKHRATYDPVIWVHTQKSLQRAFELMHTPRITAVVLTTDKDRSCPGDH